MQIESGKVVDWKLIPAEINLDYETVSPSDKVKKIMLNEFESVSSKLAKHSYNYHKLFKWQYKLEMVNHTESTLSFLIKTRGVGGMFRMVFKRFEEVKRMFAWVAKDRSKDQRDDDAINAGRKKFKQEELF